MAVRTYCYTLILLAAGLIALCWLSSCREEKAAPETRPAESPVESEIKNEPQIKELRITVGDTDLSLPAPEGFVRVAPESLPDVAFLTGGDEGGVLLCAFARVSTHSRLHPPAGSVPAYRKREDLPLPEVRRATEESGTPEPRFADGGKSGISPAEFDILRIDTLSKWLRSNFSAESFEAMKARLQSNSIACDARTVAYFAEASRAGLAEFPHYTYNLGLAGYGGRQISFAGIVKSTGAEGGALFICTVKTLLYREGKILRLGYSRRIAEFTEILPAIEAYLSYVDSLEELDGEAASPETAPAAGAFPLSASAASSFSRKEDVSGLYGSYRRNRD
jgi:hypothetical protein